MQRQTLNLITAPSLKEVKGLLRPQSGPRCLPYKLAETINPGILIPKNLPEQAVMQTLNRMDKIPLSLIATVKAVEKWDWHRNNPDAQATWSIWDLIKAFASPQVSSSKAIFQGTSGNKQDGTEAPHHMPCQIKILGLRVDEFWDEMSFQSDAVRGIYGAAFPMMKAVNSVDSLDERMGLINLTVKLHQSMSFCALSATPYQLALPNELDNFQREWLMVKQTVISHLEEVCRTTRDPVRLEKSEDQLVAAKQSYEVLRSEPITISEPMRQVLDEALETERPASE